MKVKNKIESGSIFDIDVASLTVKSYVRMHMKEHPEIYNGVETIRVIAKTGREYEDGYENIFVEFLEYEEGLGFHVKINWLKSVISIDKIIIMLEDLELKYNKNE